MGNAPAGARLGDANSSPQATPKLAGAVVAGDVSDPEAMAVRVLNHTGLEFVLHAMEPDGMQYQRECGQGPCSELPKTLGSAQQMLLFPGLAASGPVLVTYRALVPLQSSSRVDREVVGKVNHKEKKVATARDCRDQQSEQFFQLFVRIQSGGWGSGSSATLSAAFGGMRQEMRHLKHAASPAGESNCCAWAVDAAGDPSKAMAAAQVQISKTASRVVRQREGLLAALEAKKQVAAGGNEPKQPEEQQKQPADATSPAAENSVQKGDWKPVASQTGDANTAGSERRPSIDEGAAAAERQRLLERIAARRSKAEALGKSDAAEAAAASAFHDAHDEAASREHQRTPSPSQRLASELHAAAGRSVNTVISEPARQTTEFEDACEAPLDDASDELAGPPRCQGGGAISSTAPEPSGRSGSGRAHADKRVQELLDVFSRWPASHAGVFKRLLQNICDFPAEPKYRRLPLGNARLKLLLEAAPGAQEALQYFGFVPSFRAGVQVAVTEAFRSDSQLAAMLRPGLEGRIGKIYEDGSALIEFPELQSEENVFKNNFNKLRSLVLELPESAQLTSITDFLRSLSEAPAPEDEAACARKSVTRSGALAVKNREALEQKRQEAQQLAEQKRREEEAQREFEASYSHIIAAQDMEFQQSLLHDQIKDLLRERDELQEKIGSLGDQLGSAEKALQNAEQRLERYGENPRIREEAEAAGKIIEEFRDPHEEASKRLADVEAALCEKNEMVALAAYASLGD
eukprot:TRINITY_DN28218_c0_g2_i1.p1 TRINITY_DN28218_c0_g2~~TRINITY_DN28218_c0_g2_i1.p1  ORF type:complete len:748 (-),score=220.15 TRINITY_DN28218_c0_g2_i1:73-2316(-)